MSLHAVTPGMDQSAALKDESYTEVVPDLFGRLVACDARQTNVFAVQFDRSGRVSRLYQVAFEPAHPVGIPLHLPEGAHVYRHASTAKAIVQFHTAEGDFVYHSATWQEPEAEAARLALTVASVTPARGDIAVTTTSLGRHDDDALSMSSDAMTHAMGPLSAKVNACLAKMGDRATSAEKTSTMMGKVVRALSHSARDTRSELQTLFDGQVRPDEDIDALQRRLSSAGYAVVRQGAELKVESVTQLGELTLSEPAQFIARFDENTNRLTAVGLQREHRSALKPDTSSGSLLGEAIKLFGPPVLTATTFESDSPVLYDVAWHTGSAGVHMGSRRTVENDFSQTLLWTNEPENERSMSSAHPQKPMHRQAD